MSRRRNFIDGLAGLLIGLTLVVGWSKQVAGATVGQVRNAEKNASSNPPAWVETLALASSRKAVPGSRSGNSGAVSGFQFQIGEDFVKVLPPKSLPKAEENKKDALIWFLTGRLKQERGKLKGGDLKQLKAALEAYKQAAEKDPTNSQIYRALLGVAVALNDTKLALKYALKAVEQNPDDYMLLRIAGTYLAASPGGLSRAVDLLERAARSPKVNKHSSFYVALMRDLGTYYMLLQKPEKAADCFEVVLEARVNPQKFHLDSKLKVLLQKDKASSFVQIGRLFLTAKRFQRAIEAFKLAQQNGTATVSISYDLAQAYFKLGKLDEALRSIRKYLDKQLQSRGEAAYKLFTQILAKKGFSKAQVLKELEKLHQQDPENAPLAYFLASQYLEAGRLNEAQKLYEEMLAKSEDVEGYLGLVTVYRKRGDAEKLLECLSKVLAEPQAGTEFEKKLEEVLQEIVKDKPIFEKLLKAGEKKLSDKKPSLDFASSYVLGRLAMVAKKSDSAIRFLKYAIKLQQSPRKKALLYELLGTYLRDQKLYKDAAEVYREALNSSGLNPVKTYFAIRLSHSLEMDGKTDEALKVIAEARKRDDAPQLQLEEAWIYYHSYRWKEAARAFQQIIKKYSKIKDQVIRELVRRCQLSLANIYIEMGEVAKGESLLEQVWRQDPEDPSVNNDLGYLWADQGKKLDQAEKMIRKALKAEPENSAYLDSMGWVLFRKGKYKEAIGFLKQAVEKSEEPDAVLLEHLGDCYQKLGKQKKAQEAWTKALKKAKSEKRPNQKLIQRLERKLSAVGKTQTAEGKNSNKGTAAEPKDSTKKQKEEKIENKK